MVFFIILVVVLVFWLLMPYWRVWLLRRAQRRMEDMLREAMGMPKDEKPGRWQKKREERQQRKRRGHPYHPANHAQGPVIPKDYAEDVEYTEYHEFHAEVRTEVEYREEEQVSDAEWTELPPRHPSEKEKR